MYAKIEMTARSYSQPDEQPLVGAYVWPFFGFETSERDVVDAYLQE